MKIWLASLTILDASGRRGVLQFHIRTEDTILEAADDPAAYCQQFAQQLDPFIDGQIVDIRCTLAVPLPGGLKAAPLPVADLEDGISTAWRTVNNAAVRIRIPTWSEAFLLPDGQVKSTPEVLDFFRLINLPEEAAADWAIGPSDNRGSDIRFFVSAGQRFRSR